MSKSKLLPLFLPLLASSALFAGGYEKPVMWSGKWAALGGSATAGVQGSDGLFFNPAGIVRGRSHDISLNFSPVLTQNKGPITKTGETSKSDWSDSELFGALGSYQYSPKIAFAFGAYTSAAQDVNYTSLDFSNVDSSNMFVKFNNFQPDVGSNISVREFALGAAYKFDNNISLGASWRASMMSGDIKSAFILRDYLASQNKAVVATEIKDFSDKNFSGFKLGAQYHTTDNSFGIGATLRSPVTFNAEGKSSGRYQANDSTMVKELNGAGTSVVKTSLPMQVAIGTFFKLLPEDTIYFDYSWTNYSKNKNLEVTGPALTLQSGSTRNNLGDIQQSWRNGHDIRLGYEHQFTAFTLRTGYVLTTQVASDYNTHATYSATGLGHTVALGAGTIIANNSEINLGASYSMSEGKNKETTSPTNTNLSTYQPATNRGDFSSREMGAHLTYKYLF